MSRAVNGAPRTDGGWSTAARVAVVITVVASAWMTYRPEVARPFAIMDFSEFLPMLEGAPDFAGRTRALTEHYATQGRFNVVPYALIAAKWTLFGAWSPGWQLTRAAVMLALAGLTYLLLRRLGASRLASGAGALVFLYAPAASDGWVRMTMAEPLGAFIALAASLRALRFQRSARWGREVGLLCLAAVALVMTKELIAPLMILPLALALVVQTDGEFGMPARSRRNVMLVCAVALALVASLAPIFALYARAPDAAYASMYGARMQSPGQSVASWIAALVPFEVVTLTPSVPWLLAVTAFTILVAAGWRVGFHHSTEGKRARLLLALALLVPLAGVLAYIPSPWYARFYSLPYLTGTAILIGMAGTYLQLLGRKGTSWALAGWTLPAVVAIAGAAELAARSDAVQRRDDGVVSFVAQLAPADSVLFVTDRVPPYEWLGTGAALHRFAAATHRQWPVTHDVSCSRVDGLRDSVPHVVLVDFDSRCGLAAGGATIISHSYRRIHLPGMRLVRDSAEAGIVLTSASPAAR